MNNYKFKLLIKPEIIYDNLLPEQKKLFNNIQIIKSTLLDNGEVEIECLALENDVVITNCRQVMSFAKNECIVVSDI